MMALQGIPPEALNELTIQPASGLLGFGLLRHCASKTRLRRNVARAITAIGGWLTGTGVTLLVLNSV